MARDDSRSFELPIFRLLPLLIGLLLLIAIVPAVLVGAVGDRRNTAKLGSDTGEYVLQRLLDRLHDQLEPVGAQLAYVQQAVAAGRADPANQTAFDAFLLGALAATPQDIALAFILPDGSLRRYDRPTQGIAVADSAPTGKSAADGGRRTDAAIRAQVRWGEHLGQPIVEFSAPLWAGTAYHGVVSAAVRVSDLSHFLAALDLPQPMVPFILDAYGGVLAHPYLAGRSLWSEPAAGASPLPPVDGIGDPALAAFWTAPRHTLQLPQPLRAGDAHWSWVGERRQSYVYRTITDTSGRRWLIGFHRPATASPAERWTLYGIAIAGVVMLAAVLIAATWLGRQVRRPILGLATAAARLEALEFNAVKPLPHSAIAEVNAAARAFERMAAGLRWFEAYLPRALVRRLMASGHDQPAGGRRELTVMIVDVQDYAVTAGGRPAEQVAGALNRLFGRLGPLIEATGGTIDKYVGDGLIAFWGAPDDRPLHASDACRSALAFGPALDALVAEAPSSLLAHWRLRVGIQTGEVIAGNVGFPGRITYTIIGDAVNAAQRLEALGKREIGSDRLVILVGEAVKARAAAAFVFAEVADVPAEFAGVGRIYRLLDARLEGLP